MFDTGTTAFMLVCAMLVLLMTPGLAFFYGGLSRRKNVVNTMAMCMAVLGVVGVLWVAAGWSFAYGGDGSLPFFGGFDQLGLAGLVQNLLAEEGTAVSHGTYPAIADVAFQLAFAAITCAIITGAVAGRMKFGAVVLFVAIWVLAVYAPLAHMVWGGEGSLIGEMIGALDFAGGDVVHISSGLTGLVLCVLLGRRKGFGMMNYRPHNRSSCWARRSYGSAGSGSMRVRNSLRTAWQLLRCLTPWSRRAQACCLGYWSNGQRWASPRS